MIYNSNSIAALLDCKPAIKSFEITRFSTDSRDCAGACFIAIKGETFDGNRFAESAFANGATCSILDNKEIYASLTGKGMCCLFAENSIEALGTIATDYRSRLRATTIAITGSNGKTTTREMIRSVLSKYFKLHCAVKSFNNNIGLPLTILSAPTDCEVLLLEVGTNHPGEIEPLAKIASPEIAVITNVFPSHIGNFGSVEAIAKEKAAILAGLKPGGKLFAGAGAEIEKQLAGESRCTFFSLDKRRGALQPDDYSFDETSCSLRINAVQITAPLPGRANLHNLLATYLVCRQMGLTSKEIVAGAADISGVDGRLKITHCGAGTIIDDCYNCNPGSLSNALSLLASIKTGGRRIAVLGDMKELGDFSVQCHEEAGAMAAKCCERLYAFGEFAATTARACEAAGGKSKAFDEYQRLEEHLLNSLRRDDIVLVKGSRSMQMERLLKPLSDKMCVLLQSEVSL
ncbi:MAG: UDP-N-acetylmuramoyl-tripeptide--D-alanyl-D-alanine ligase [Phycisphaerae bacterium]